MTEKLMETAKEIEHPSIYDRSNLNRFLFLFFGVHSAKKILLHYPHDPGPDGSTSGL